MLPNLLVVILEPRGRMPLSKYHKHAKAQIDLLFQREPEIATMNLRLREACAGPVSSDHKLMVQLVVAQVLERLISDRDRLFEARLATINLFFFRNQRPIQSRLRGIGLAHSYSLGVRTCSNRRRTLCANSMQNTWSVTTKKSELL